MNSTAVSFNCVRDFSQL